MRMVFLGDIGIDRPVTPDAAAGAWFRGADLVVANLEGAVLPAEVRGELRERAFVALHNAPEVLEALGALGVGAVALANNHVYDYDVSIGRTRSALAEAGIGSFGAGNREQAAAPLVVPVDGTPVRLYAFGWEPIGCRAATAGREGANPLRAGHVLETARRARREDPDALVIFLMHWNYELEPYPQPAHRQLAHDLIAAGVDAVVGGHPHVAGGVEVVAGKPIFYSLGNWLFPPRVVKGFQVSYPPVSRLQLAAELEWEGRRVRDIRLRWHDFDPATLRVEPVSTEGVDGPTAAGLTPFAGLDHAAYLDWFRAHRFRSRALPVYADYGAASNAGRDAYLRLRRGAGEVLARLGLKREQRGRSRGGESG